MRQGGGDEELSFAAAGADVHRSQGGGRTDRGARDDARARGRRLVAAKTSPKGKARCDRGLRYGNGGNAPRSRRRFGVRRDRAPGEHPQGNKMTRGEVYWADLVPRSGSRDKIGPVNIASLHLAGLPAFARRSTAADSRAQSR